MEPSNDAIPRDEKQLAYELWREANHVPKWKRRIKRRTRSDRWWHGRKARAEARKKVAE